MKLLSFDSFSEGFILFKLSTTLMVPESIPIQQLYLIVSSVLPRLIIFSPSFNFILWPREGIIISLLQDVKALPSIIHFIGLFFSTYIVLGEYPKISAVVLITWTPFSIFENWLSSIATSVFSLAEKGSDIFNPTTVNPLFAIINPRNIMSIPLNFIKFIAFLPLIKRQI